ncbi:hypothetical protein B0T09DRAFT_345529 [Sordaria sp. MPI-SDFR-AT-0083]|nr:hypothetical protein B0T09DRAFT_345529 [Sordaria sp. MPI-SDFR-AT-0083]
MTTNNNLADTATLIQLKGEKNLGDWESALWVALDCANLTDYVFSPKDKPEPKDKDSEKYETWRANRARAEPNGTTWSKILLVTGNLRSLTRTQLGNSV